MAVLRVRKFSSTEDVNFFLAGGITGGSLMKAVPGLVGRTLIFTKPSAATVTFVAGADTTGQTLSPLEIQTQIQAAIATVRAGRVGYDGHLSLMELNPTSGVAISAAGTANALLGFSSSAETAGKLVAPPGGSVPALVTMYFDPVSNSHAVVTQE
jgi:hypothetical protein